MLFECPVVDREESSEADDSCAVLPQNTQPHLHYQSTDLFQNLAKTDPNTIGI
jgi:hypothetical protein